MFSTLSMACFRSLRLMIPMITARQIRAARALLGWSQQFLADQAIVSVNAVIRLERGKVDSRLSTLTAVQRALSKGGVEFIPSDGKGEGVRLLRPSGDDELSPS